MITSFDPEYQITKEISLGKRKLPEISRRLIEWINEKYKVKAINIYYDILEPDNRSRIQVIFDNHKDVSKFQENGIGNYLPVLQNQIADKYTGLVSEMNLQDSYFTDRVFVCYSDFSSIYRSQLYESVPSNELEDLFKKYTNDLVWQIHLNGSGLIIFFYNNIEKENPDNDAMVERLKNEYFALLKPYDELNYLSRTWILKESKEDFENIYKGDWYNWSRDH
jgi:hypothetical protein